MGPQIKTLMQARREEPVVGLIMNHKNTTGRHSLTERWTRQNSFSITAHGTHSPRNGLHSGSIHSAFAHPGVQ
jgi:hypothetical protein